MRKFIFARQSDPMIEFQIEAADLEAATVAALLVHADAEVTGEIVIIAGLVNFVV